MDASTLVRINLAHPKIREELRVHYEQANNLLGKGVRLRLPYVLRTHAEQNALHALGRTKVNPDGKTAKKPMGNIVTNAKGGQSIHNFGLAFDIVMLYDNNGDGVFEEASWSMTRDGDRDSRADWMEIVAFFKSKGWEWGGDWKKFKDAPHFQKTFGFDWRVLQQRIDKGITIVDNGITYAKI